MTNHLHTTQRLIDAMVEQPAIFATPAPLERIVELAKLGVRDPNMLDADDVQVICDALLTHYAQMGIG